VWFKRICGLNFSFPCGLDVWMGIVAALSRRKDAYQKMANYNSVQAAACRRVAAT
jgi:hypothetical protein